MYDYKGKTALITGASSGIGKAFAHEIAGRGMNLVLVARSEDKLLRLAEDLKQNHHIQVEVVVADLSKEESAQEVYDTVKRNQQQVDLLINNAGIVTHGLFAEKTLRSQQDEIRLNVYTPVSLSHLFIQDMFRRGQGAIMNVASTGGFQPMPYRAIYSATKAFLINWSEAVWAEAKEKGVSIVTLCPGPTDTNIYEAMGTNDSGVGKMVPPEHVVHTGLRALEKQQMTVIDGRSNYWISQAYRFFPRQTLVNLMYRMFHPKSTRHRKKTSF
ncbi:MULTISPECIES: SDR family NAD(P)-dependent oxidoreductase [Paenibacillus]|uniref:Short-chain dehydrogenase n=1 Tax=Paenibacillus albilobatus TaxID=2716884 RepID=A0A920CBV2_9BACL|nr:MULTISPECIES: SDR family oxidoreductase [Paenibacillus]GIO31329.1 short-chain dehydrogenase [Paenibacillus albilobatus]